VIWEFPTFKIHKRHLKRFEASLIMNIIDMTVIPGMIAIGKHPCVIWLVGSKYNFNNLPIKLIYFIYKNLLCVN
jgi:hypothetical protein